MQSRDSPRANICPQPKKEKLDVGRTTQPKTNVVVTVVRIVVVAVRGVRVVLIVVPGAAAQHTRDVSREPCWQHQLDKYSYHGAAMQISKKSKGASRP